jgi:asparagine synthase (glutamine-hydrolysing)
MCGIAGIVARSPLSAREIALARRMSDDMQHRGPDGAGEYRGEHVHLAMRRLSIIGVQNGDQPLFNEDRSLALIASGEIYNYRELRAELCARGHRFAGESDFEPLLHLYEETGGAAALERLRGMFAFALWDQRHGRLTLARDRMGEKPLYLHQNGESLVFASEMKALLRSGVVDLRLDPVGVNEYFHYQFVPEPRTIVDGVRKLDAAHVLTIDVGPWTITERAYWRMDDAPPIHGDPVARIRGELETIGGLIVRSERPVGVALSGGIDSSAVAALAARATPNSLTAFAVGYPGHPPMDERDAARAVADHLRVPLQEVEITTGHIVDEFPAMLLRRDDPIADISGSGYDAVARAAHAHGVPVLLQGHGGDELFWYDEVQAAVHATEQKERRRGRPIAAWLAAHRLAGPLGRSPRALASWARSGFGMRAGARLYRYQRRAPESQMVFYETFADFLDAARDIPALYDSSFLERIDGQRPEQLFDIPLPWPRADIMLTKLICDTYLRENGIAQTERLGMGWSVETRLPFVDHHLVETVIGLRKAHTDVGEAPKHWLRGAVADLLPADVLTRPKSGFAPPLDEWHRALFAAYGGQLVDGYLVQSRVLTPAAGRRLALGEFPRGAVAPLSFKALVLELWCRGVVGDTGSA